jgi:hypothetical protein
VTRQVRGPYWLSVTEKKKWSAVVFATQNISVSATAEGPFDFFFVNNFCQITNKVRQAGVS